jgi:hypothetical protein
MAITGLTNYPSLETIANLVRTIVNDDQAGATGTAGEGQILTDSSVTLQNLMNSAIRDTYRDTRIMGQPTLIKDNYLVLNMPPINSTLGVGVVNPAIQVALTFDGYFDGLETQTSWTNSGNVSLPSDMILPLEMWEREASSPNPFEQMHQASGALCPRMQTSCLGEWEWRTDSIWMNGATLTKDIRLRYIATYADLASSSIDWSTTYVPVMDSQEAIADKISVRYAARLGGDALADAKLSAAQSLLKLKQQVTRDRQKIDYRTRPYGNGAGSAGDPSAMLY